MDSSEALARLRRIAGNLLARLRLRRREPWNWCVQNAGLALLAPGLLFHNAGLCGMAFLAVAAGFLELPLPPMRTTEFAPLVPRIETLIGREIAWFAAPSTPRKRRSIILWTAGALVTARLLWTQDVGPIGLAVAAIALLIVRRRNIDDGIKP